jgi:hypothetical protein
LDRWELEARLLADQSDVDIAAKCSLSVEAVQNYSDLFYDVRRVLAADTYISLVVLGGNHHTGIKPDDFETLLKIYGYSIGKDAVDEVLHFIREPPTVPASLNQLDLSSLKRLRQQLQIKVSILLQTTPTSAASPATWVRLSQDYVAERRTTTDRAENETTMLCSIKSALGVMEILSNDGRASADAMTTTLSTSDAVCKASVYFVDRDKLTSDLNTPSSVPA